MESVFYNNCQQVVGWYDITNKEYITLMESNAVFVNVVQEVCVLQV